MVQRRQCVVIGGGLSGLYITQALARTHTDVILLEAAAQPGGRIQSVYEDDGALRYEAGPWRIPSTHTRVLRLFKRLGVSLRTLTTPSSRKTTSPPPQNGLSTWDVSAMLRGPLCADLKDLRTGYAGETHAESSTHPYVVDTQQFFVSDDGFSNAVSALRSNVAKRLVCNARVVDIQRHGDAAYKVEYMLRCGDTFHAHTVITDAIFVCVPPSVSATWSIFSAHANAWSHSVASMPLCHVYAKSRASAAMRFHKIVEQSVCGQLISSSYGNEWFQASYTAGRLADFWKHISLCDPTQFERLIRAGATQHLGISDITAVNIRHWERAFHYWRPVVSFNIETAVTRAIMPNPALLPRCFSAGEAFSSYQAWMEGALETAELALDAFARQRSPLCSYRVVLPTEFYIEGRVLDTTQWQKVHPGSEKAITSHRGHDARQLFQSVGHSPAAWATVNALTKEFVVKLNK